MLKLSEWCRSFSLQHSEWQPYINEPPPQCTYATAYHCHSNPPSRCWGPLRTAGGCYNNHTPGGRLVMTASWVFASLVACFLQKYLTLWLHLKSSGPKRSLHTNMLVDGSNQHQPNPFSWGRARVVNKPRSASSPTDLNLERIRNTMRWHPWVHTLTFIVYRDTALILFSLLCLPNKSLTLNPILFYVYN